MSVHLCGCGNPAPTATLCTTCGLRLDDALAEIAAYRGLGWDLRIQVARRTQPRMTDVEIAEERRAPGVLVANPLPYSPHAASVAQVLYSVLREWAWRVADETGARDVSQPQGPVCRGCQHASCKAIRRWPDLPPDTIAGLATWLRPRAGWLRHHPAGQEALDAILDAVHEARRVCDRPAERIYAGPCSCGEDLYARLGAEYITCHSHERPVVWEVADRRRWLLAAVEDVLATTTEISRALTLWNQEPLTSSMIRGYVKRKKLFEKGERKEPGRAAVPLYRVGDVLDILARQRERVAS